LPYICVYSYNNNRWLDASQVYINILENNEFAGINQGHDRAATDLLERHHRARLQGMYDLDPTAQQRLDLDPTVQRVALNLVKPLLPFSHTRASRPPPL